MRNLGLAVDDSFGYGPCGLAVEPVCVVESAQGGTDLNGDGDSADLVLHVVDPQTAS